MGPNEYNNLVTATETLYYTDKENNNLKLMDVSPYSITVSNNTSISFSEEDYEYEIYQKWLKKLNVVNFPKVDKLKFYDRTTIVWWSDGTKTHVTAQKGDGFDKEKGIAMCFMKKALGNKGNFNDELTTLLGENLQEKRRAKRRERKENRRSNNA